MLFKKFILKVYLQQRYEFLEKNIVTNSVQKHKCSPAKAKRKRDVAEDIDSNLVFLAESAWTLNLAQENHPKVWFNFTSEG